ncbi:hypothetical protein [Paraburkholderia aspalathi]
MTAIMAFETSQYESLENRGAAMRDIAVAFALPAERHIGINAVFAYER